MLERQKIDISEELRILTLLITNTEYLRQVSTICKPEYFESTYVQRIATWVLEYFAMTQSAPNRAIEEIWMQRRHDLRNDEEVQAVGAFLSNLSEHAERHVAHNVPYSAKGAEEYFKIQSLKLLTANLKQAVDIRDTRTAEAVLRTYTDIAILKDSTVSLMHDSDKINAAFLDAEQGVLALPGSVGDAVGSLGRGDFFAIVAPPKRGKTFFFAWMAEVAVRSGLNVFFASFEMTESQMIRRLWRTISGGAIDSNEYVDIPTFTLDEEDREIILTRKRAKDALADIAKKQRTILLHSRRGDIRLMAYPAYGATVRDIENTLHQLEYYDGYIPDVIIVDYADIMQPLDKRMDYRHQLDDAWKHLRRVAAERNCLVVTGSQSGRKTTGGKKDVEQEDIAEDMRKLAHVTHLASLNQTEMEQQHGITRLRILLRREGRATSKHIVMLGNLDIGHICLESAPVETFNIDKYNKAKE